MMALRDPLHVEVERLREERHQLEARVARLTEALGQAQEDSATILQAIVALLRRGPA